MANELNGPVGSIGEQLYNGMPRYALTRNPNFKLEMMIRNKTWAFPMLRTSVSAAWYLGPLPRETKELLFLLGSALKSLLIFFFSVKKITNVFSICAPEHCVWGKVV